MHQGGAGMAQWCQSTRLSIESQKPHLPIEFLGSLLCTKRTFLQECQFPLSSKTKIWPDCVIVNFSYSVPN